VKFFELQIEFMVPLWRRVLLVLVCLVWPLVEFVNGSQGWGIVFFSLGAYCFWPLFLEGWFVSLQQANSEADDKATDSTATGDQRPT